ncbi:hypothetical protein PZH37_20375, partial [[Eubacterium] siraeum]|nr:hypothetical protein [[Eubacterium] siraeum]
AWYNSLMNTVVGQIVLAVSAVGIFISTAIVIKLTKPIEYKREGAKECSFYYFYSAFCWERGCLCCSPTP